MPGVGPDQTSTVEPNGVVILNLLDNVRFLAGYRRRSVIAADLIPAVLGAAGQQPTIGGIERALGDRQPPQLVRPVVLHLLWTGLLRADLTHPLSAETAVALER
jgi:hypothetical protein